MTHGEKLQGVILGTAIGDAVGLPAEGLSRRKLQELGWTDHWQHRLIGHSGMFSDDTEHTLLVAEALSQCDRNVDAFRKILASKLKLWILMLPAGVGLATMRALIKLCFGVSPSKSGVFSAGNGPAMRSALIGAYFEKEPELIHPFVEASTRITHTDPKALVGALAVAYAAASHGEMESLWEQLNALSRIESTDWPHIVQQLKESVEGGISTLEYTKLLHQEQGVSGYVYHTVPVALFVWIRCKEAPNAFQDAITEILNCGGDTDTTGAIVGALIGATNEVANIPQAWINGIVDWPNNVSRLRNCAQALENEKSIKSLNPIATLLRNVFFLAIVLTHGFLRLVPTKLRRRNKLHGMHT